MAEKKTNVNALFGVLGLLVVILAVAVYLLIDTRKNLNLVSSDLSEKTEFFRLEKDSLEGELRNIYFRYDTLETNNLELQVEMKQQQEKIDKLIAIQADDTYKIRMYRKEMETLRSVLRSYIVQIDSLNMQNQELRAENKQLRNTELRLSTEKEQLQKDKSQLEEIKDMATTLQASQIDLVMLNKRDKESDRIRTAVKVRIDFVLRANNVAPPGEKKIALRIIRPDQIVLGSPELEMIEYNGEQIPVSATRVINYENEDLPVSIFWNNDGEIVPGEHTVELYADGKIIGQSSFVLK
jgi:predicted RNase H-like nuclease (RuvC/YqgF family)